METKANYVLIGAATLIGAVLLMVFAMWLANSEYRRGYNEFQVVFDDPVRGLAEGGEVRFNGIKVGEVRELRIDPNNTRRVIAMIRVAKEVRVREDSIAQLEPIGLTGVTLIQLSPGTPESPLALAEMFGQPPLIVGRVSQIDMLVAQSEQIVRRANQTLDGMGELLNAENTARVKRVLANLETITDRLAAPDSVLVRSGETAAATTALVQQMQLDLAGLDQVVTQANAVLATANSDTLPQMGLAAEELRRAAAAVTRVATSIEENPSILTPRSPRRVVELPP
jgi:phospholipid/cholesterol/gamma-HCH transport system substrate-binding protein